MNDMIRRGVAPAPPTVDRRQFLYGGVLLAAVASAAAAAPRRTVNALQQGALVRSIPLTIGPYRFATQSGLILPPQDDLSARIYDEVLTRVYVAPGLPAIMLLIAYGSVQDSGLQLHRPEVCYPGAGFTISDLRAVPLSLPKPGAHAIYLTATRGGQEEQIYYWTRVGQEFPASAWDEKFAVLRANLHRQLPDGVLVRTSIASNDHPGALAHLVSFNKLLFASSGAAGRRILLGSAG